jgi:hypothetical protein
MKIFLCMGRGLSRCLGSPLEAGFHIFGNFSSPAVNGWPNSPSGKPAEDIDEKADLTQ